MTDCNPPKRQKTTEELLEEAFERGRKEGYETLPDPDYLSETGKKFLKKLFLQKFVALKVYQLFWLIINNNY